MNKFSKFLSSSTMKTPEGSLVCSDKNGRIISEERVPSGLRLDQYIRSLYPNVSFGYSFRSGITKEGIKVSLVVVIDEKDSVHHMYAIFYDKV